MRKLSGTILDSAFQRHSTGGPSAWREELAMRLLSRSVQHVKYSEINWKDVDGLWDPEGGRYCSSIAGARLQKWPSRRLNSTNPCSGTFTKPRWALLPVIRHCGCWCTHVIHLISSLHKINLTLTSRWGFAQALSFLADIVLSSPGSRRGQEEEESQQAQPECQIARRDSGVMSQRRVCQIRSHGGARANNSLPLEPEPEERLKAWISKCIFYCTFTKQQEYKKSVHRHFFFCLFVSEGVYYANSFSSHNCSKQSLGQTDGSGAGAGTGGRERSRRGTIKLS